MGPSLWLNRNKSKSRLSLIDENRDGPRAQPMQSISETIDYDNIVTTQQMQLSSHEHTIRQLKENISQYEATITQHQTTIDSLRYDVSGFREEQVELEKQVWSYSEQLNRSKEQTDTLRVQLQERDSQVGNSEGQISHLTRQLQWLNEQNQGLTTSCQENSQELATKSRNIQVLSSHNQKMQNTVSDMERVVELASRNTGMDIHQFYREQATLRTAHEELQTAHDSLTSSLQAEEEACQRLRDALQAMEIEKSSLEASKLRSQEESLQNLQASLQAMEVENSSAIQVIESENASLRTVIEELQREVSNMENCQPQTLRSLLTLRLAEQAPTAQSTDDELGFSSQAADWLPTGLSAGSLDKQCNTDEIQTFAALLPRSEACNQFYSRLRLEVCSMCSKTKFKLQFDTRNRQNPVNWLNEFHDSTRYFSCCNERVCKDCFKTHIIDTLQTKWWYKIGTTQWFPCPREGCVEALGIRCEADLQICLERNCGVDADEHLNMYIKATAFRQALETLDPKPSDEALQKSSLLHQSLAAANRMYSLFDPRFDPSLVDETGCIPEFQPGTIHLAAMDTGGPVPLFLKFLRRESSPKSCMVCTKSLFDIDYGDIESWKAACVDFKGDWMWNLLVFPTSEIQQCDHDFDVCKVCTAEHIRGTLTSGGPSACDNLSCPQCRKKLSPQEIRHLADAETFAKYDKFLLQTYLSHDPNFRWCLSPLCKNGQLYERAPRHPKITCESEDCEYEMCFTHSMPWHEGMTCDEYESLRDHGDPSYAETQAWIRTNTKPCPGCQVDVQKGEACFHMTCSQCDHQFCWQCLADWTDIRASGQEGHAEGCFFRTNDVRPTGVRGENLEDALRARGGG